MAHSRNSREGFPKEKSFLGLGGRRLSPFYPFPQTQGCLPQKPGNPAAPHQPGPSPTACSPLLFLLPAFPTLPRSWGWGRGLVGLEEWRPAGGGGKPLDGTGAGRAGPPLCCLCRRLSIIALPVTPASHYLSQADPAHPPLYWFLLGLQKLITYTCSWEMQAGLRGDGEKAPPIRSPLPQPGLFRATSLELDWDGLHVAACGSAGVGRKRPRARKAPGTFRPEAQSSLVKEHGNQSMTWVLGLCPPNLSVSSSGNGAGGEGPAQAGVLPPPPPHHNTNSILPHFLTNCPLSKEGLEYYGGFSHGESASI